MVVHEDIHHSNADNKYGWVIITPLFKYFHFKITDKNHKRNQKKNVNHHVASNFRCRLRLGRQKPIIIFLNPKLIQKNQIKLNKKEHPKNGDFEQNLKVLDYFSNQFMIVSSHRERQKGIPNHENNIIWKRQNTVGVAFAFKLRRRWK